MSIIRQILQIETAIFSLKRLYQKAESQYIELKSQAMTLWTNAILDEYERQKGDA